MQKHSLIVGGTKGMGRALVKVFADKNHPTHLTSVIARRLPSRDNREMPRVHYWTADLLDSKRLRKVLGEIIRQNGKLNSLIFFQRYRGSKNEWEGEIKTSLTATKNVIELLASRFDKSGESSIVIVSSVVGHFVADEVPLSYHVTRAALNQMVRYYAVRLAPRKIRVNGISATTLLKEESKDFYLKNKRLLEFYRKITPLGRMGTAEEVAHVIDFLCSEKSSFVTGQNITVDGGVTLQWQESLARKLSSSKFK